MISRKNWSQKQDQALQQIIAGREIGKWTTIASILEKEYGVVGRTGKQCRERWHNQLEPRINRSEWTDQQQELLLKCHDVYGSKWAKIAHYFPGRTDNAIKNHFYSTFRKSMRRLNRFINQSGIKPAVGEITPQMLSNIIGFSSERYQSDLSELKEKCLKIKHKLFEHSRSVVLTPNREGQLQAFVKEILEFDTKVKCTPFRLREQSYFHTQDFGLNSLSQESLICKIDSKDSSSIQPHRISITQDISNHTPISSFRPISNYRTETDLPQFLSQHKLSASSESFPATPASTSRETSVTEAEEILIQIFGLDIRLGYYNDCSPHQLQIVYPAKQIRFPLTINIKPILRDDMPPSADQKTIIYQATAQ